MAADAAGRSPVALEYYTATQVSAMTGISTKRSSECRNAHRPALYKCGRRVRYKAADVRAWVERGGPIE